MQKYPTVYQTLPTLIIYNMPSEMQYSVRTLADILNSYYVQSWIARIILQLISLNAYAYVNTMYLYEQEE